MEYLIIFIAMLALAHFVWEGIVAPSYRAKLRNELFEVRDELRTLKIEGRENCSREAFDIVQGAVNQYLNHLSEVDLAFAYRVSHAFRKKELSEEVKRRKKILDECTSEEMRKVIRRTGMVLEAAFLTNSAAWGIYLLPIVGIVAIVVEFSSWVAAKFSRTFLKWVTLPEAKIEKLLPAHAIQP